MPRAPSEKMIEAEKLFNNGMAMVKIAKKLGVSDGTVRSWKNRYKWGDNSKETNKNNCNVANKDNKKSATLQKKNRGGQPKNKNADGNSGGAPKRNKNAERHGFFSKYLPEDALQIIEELEEKKAIDILWENIQLSYAAILRAQRTMYVKSQDEMIKEIKKIKKKEDETEVEWEFQFAWDRQATFLNAQAKAMSELRSLIRQYEEIATDEQKAKVARIKAETERMKQDAQGDKNNAVDDWIAAVLEEDEGEDVSGDEQELTSVKETVLPEENSGI